MTDSEVEDAFDELHDRLADEVDEWAASDEDDDDEPKVKKKKQVVLALPANLVKELRHQCIDDDITVADAVALAVTAWLKDRP